jgi:hypothetical protein
MSDLTKEQKHADQATDTQMEKFKKQLKPIIEPEL